jgi:hypothetical protein
MRVGFLDLTLWSLLMASAHGAGLMLVPVLLGFSSGHEGHGDHSTHFSGTFDSPVSWLAAVVVHSLGHLLVAALIALLVYEKLGLALLRKTWFNLDLLWMMALLISGVLILVL